MRQSFNEALQALTECTTTFPELLLSKCNALPKEPDINLLSPNKKYGFKLSLYAKALEIDFKTLKSHLENPDTISATMKTLYINKLGTDAFLFFINKQPGLLIEELDEYIEEFDFETIINNFPEDERTNYLCTITNYLDNYRRISVNSWVTLCAYAACTTEQQNILNYTLHTFIDDSGKTISNTVSINNIIQLKKISYKEKSTLCNKNCKIAFQKKINEYCQCDVEELYSRMEHFPYIESHEWDFLINYLICNEIKPEIDFMLDAFLDYNVQYE